MALEASEVAVRVRLIGGSAYEADAAKVAASTEAIGTAGKKASAAAVTGFGALGGKLDHVGSKMMSFGRTLTMAGIPLAAAGYYASKSATQFQQNMTLLATNANEQMKNIGWMSKSVLSMGKDFGQLPNEMAKGLYNFESVGIHGKKALTDIKAAAMGSAVGLDDLANTTDAVSTVMMSKIAGAGGPVEAMSKMDRAIGLGKMHLADLTGSFKSGIIPLAQQFKLDFPSVLGTISALSAVGTPPTQIAARMRLMLTSMEALSTGGAKALSKVGIGPYDLANDLSSPGHLITALQDLKMHLSNLPGPQQNAILAAVFGRSRGMGQIAGSLSQLDTITQDYGLIAGTTPALLEKHFQQTKGTTAFKEKAIRAQFDADMIQLGQTINLRVLPVLIRLIRPLQSVVNDFGKMPHWLQDFSLGLAGAVIVGGPFFMFTGALVKGAGMLTSGIGAMVGIEGLAGFRLAVASSVAELALIAAPIAAVLGVYEMWKNKGVRHAIEGTGKKAGSFVGDYLAKDLKALGFSHADDYYATQRYLSSKQFKGYKPVIQADIEGLMNPKSYAANHLGEVYRDFAQFGKGVNLNDVPGISAAVKQAIKDGMKEANVNVLLPNGKVIAQTVNDVNRKVQNRR